MQKSGMRKPATVIVLHRLVHDDEELMARARRIVARACVVIEERQAGAGETQEGSLPRRS